MDNDDTRWYRSGPGPDTYEHNDRRDGHLLPQADWDAVVEEAEALHAQYEADGTAAAARAAVVEEGPSAG